VIVDEASRVPNELYEALVPMLGVSQGRLLALSTPAGRRGWWFEAWSGPGDWERTEIPASACPRLAPAWLDAQRQLMPASWYEQEFNCRFLEVDDAAFAYDDVHGALDPSVTPLFPLP